MDRVLPNKTCHNLPITQPGQTFVSSNFVRGQGLVIDGVSDEWATGYSYEQTNNTPPIPIFVRVQPSLKHPNKKVFWINGWERPRLFLIKGKNYVFNINTFEYPFYMTTDSNGGHGEINNVTGVPASSYDKRTYSIPNASNTLTNFYYQCPLMKDMGGDIIILDKHPSKN